MKRFFFLCSIVIVIFVFSSLIEAEELKGKFYVIGVGPAGPEYLTIKALETLKKVDVILCDEGTLERFKEYLKDKEYLGNPWEGMWSYKGKTWQEILKMSKKEKEEFQRERIRLREEWIKKIREKMKNGKNVALLDIGDPCIFGPSHWFLEGFEEDEVEIIPGVGAFSASMAALKKSSIPAYNTLMVVQTAPTFLFKKKEVLKDLSKYESTLVFYMALEYLEELVTLLKKYYPPTLPIAIVYYAGYPDKEKVVKGTLEDILKKVEKEKERWMGMVIVGKCLEGKPYRGAIERQLTN